MHCCGCRCRTCPHCGGSGVVPWVRPYWYPWAVQPVQPRPVIVCEPPRVVCGPSPMSAVMRAKAALGQ